MWCFIKFVFDNWGFVEVDFIFVYDIKLIYMFLIKKKLMLWIFYVISLCNRLCLVFVCVILGI